MTIHVIGRTVACRLFVAQFPSEATAQAFAASTSGADAPGCDGLQYPDACYAEQASWEEARPCDS